MKYKCLVMHQRDKKCEGFERQSVWTVGVLCGWDFRKQNKQERALSDSNQRSDDAISPHNIYSSCPEKKQKNSVAAAEATFG